MQIKLADVNKVRIFTSVTTTNTHTMRATKINQLEKIVARIVELGKDIDNAEFNGESEIKIAKLQANEQKAIVRAEACVETMTEAEFDATSFEYMLCMSYEEAKS